MGQQATHLHLWVLRKVLQRPHVVRGLLGHQLPLQPPRPPRVEQLDHRFRAQALVLVLVEGAARAVRRRAEAPPLARRLHEDGVLCDACDRGEC